MVSIDSVERGLARYIDESFLPGVSKDSAKGFAMGMAASLLVKRGGVLLRTYAKHPVLQQMGLVTADGAVDMDAIREAALSNMPATGVAVDLPIGIGLRIKPEDVTAIYNAIMREASV